MFNRRVDWRGADSTVEFLCVLGPWALDHVRHSSRVIVDNNWVCYSVRVIATGRTIDEGRLAMLINATVGMKVPKQMQWDPSHVNIVPQKL